jgi:hypothetical protein
MPRSRNSTGAPTAMSNTSRALPSNRVSCMNSFTNSAKAPSVAANITMPQTPMSHMPRCGRA